MQRTISIRCGVHVYELETPEETLLHIVSPPRGTGAKNGDIERLAALRLSGNALAEAAAGHDGRALIICDDATRPTPVAEILPALCSALERLGIPYSGQHLLFATGTHRPVTEDEAKGKLGRMYGRIAWSCHDRDAELADLGATPGGIPVLVNPLLLQYRLIIGIGSVVPHRYCGWSGGGKIILPGVSGAKSIAATHWMPSRDGDIYLGSTKNTAMSEIMEAAKKARLSFLIQAVCEGEGYRSVRDITAGAPEAAHEAAIKTARESSGVAVSESDLVIASAWPEDIDLWQAGKALYSAEIVVRPRGKILLVAGLKEGLGTHCRFAELIKSGKSTALAYRDSDDAELALDAAAAYVTHNVMDLAEVYLLTPSPYAHEIEDASGIKTFTEAEQAAACIFAKDVKNITILQQAPFVLPLK